MNLDYADLLITWNDSSLNIIVLWLPPKKQQTGQSTVDKQQDIHSNIEKLRPQVLQS